ncbi:hypothetical protein KNP414_03558 [Paenibacillus mucilaginosus KNP414]|uniref:Uncharacterized protein n=1 Tax=Paenibacillus mucilaginosus (strain KNP414) TaxID=1036673 RepID=F8FDD2_PAEMK|nr:hypothetical protein KNP414_03558 [Paenibacillus mucilaginosus KNP414]
MKGGGDPEHRTAASRNRLSGRAAADRWLDPSLDPGSTCVTQNILLKQGAGITRRLPAPDKPDKPDRQVCP